MHYLRGLFAVACGVMVTHGAWAAQHSDFPHGAVIARGVASWYGLAEDGRTTASGEAMDRQRLTAASPNIPMGTVVEVINKRNGRSVQVLVNDRGPARRVQGTGATRRIIDVSPVAARELGIRKKGLAPVVVRALAFE
jgi:rare lipoprotein A